MNNKKKALEELTIAESLNPMFDEEFLIYRYSKLITDQLGDKENDPDDQEIDVVGAIAFENHKKLCIEFIRQASQFHKKFWMELLEDIPSKKSAKFKTWKS